MKHETNKERIRVISVIRSSQDSSTATHVVIDLFDFDNDEVSSIYIPHITAKEAKSLERQFRYIHDSVRGRAGSEKNKKDAKR